MGARDFESSVKNSTLPEEETLSLSSVLTDFASAKKERSKSADPHREFAQGRTLTILTRAARDMRRITPARTSSSAARHGRTNRAEDQLRNEVVRIALVNRARDDICDSKRNEDYPHTRQFPFRWKRTPISNTIEENPSSDPALDEERWRADLIQLLSKSVTLHANIICFGEFDYPQFGPADEAVAAERSFEHQIMKVVDGANWPVFAVLGSFHRTLRLTGDVAGEWTGPLAQNVAKIALSEELRNPGAKSIREVLKRTPASKAGELLTGFHGIDMEVFDTIIGKFAVVICSDAYDPSIVLEYFAASALPDHKRDIILVPSYNKSAKQAHMCQVLSLTSGSIVVMVDACREHTGGSGPFEKSSAWACGIPVNEATAHVLFGDKHKVCRWVAEDTSEAGSIKVLEVSLPALHILVDHMDTVDPMPLFKGVRLGAWPTPAQS